MRTSDERREVASSLRGDPNDTLIPQSRDGFEGMTYNEAAYRFWNMCRRVRSAADVDIAYSTTSVLADLIDPTCTAELKTVVVGEHYRRTRIVPTCSVCGSPLDGGIGGPCFCPGCGARCLTDRGHPGATTRLCLACTCIARRAAGASWPACSERSWSRAPTATTRTT